MTTNCSSASSKSVPWQLKTQIDHDRLLLALGTMHNACWNDKLENTFPAPMENYAQSSKGTKSSHSAFLTHSKHLLTNKHQELGSVLGETR